MTSIPFSFESESYFKRLFKFSQMDRESAVWQLSRMYFNPSSVKRMITTHRHAKGIWNRDDPAFLMLETLCVVCISVLWYFLPLTPFSTATLVRSLLSFVVFDFFVVGLVISTALWYCVNRWGKAPISPHSTEEDIGWKYCFDVFCNAFVTVMINVDLGFVVYAVLRCFSHGWFVRVFLGNTILMVGLVHFIVMTLSFILVIPFVTRLDVILFIAPVLVAYVLSLLFSVDGGKRWMSFHFAAYK